MKAYICQIGDENDGEMPESSYSEDLHAYSLIEAIEKARAIAVKREPHDRETAVYLVDEEADPKIVWSRPMVEVRDT